MAEMYGYGEDSLTLWALKQHITEILDKDDNTSVSDCLVLYRPSFGRSGGSNSPEFGEFDAIIASSKKIYLVESKWDNLLDKNTDRELINDVQRLRHRVFSWYLTHWNRRYLNNWQKFVDEQALDFTERFKGEKVIATEGLLTRNLQQVLSMLLVRSKGLVGEQSIQNVLLFLHRKPTSHSKVNKGFRTVNIDYCSDLLGNFVRL